VYWYKDEVRLVKSRWLHEASRNVEPIVRLY
jgi:hypothetical protein